MALSIANNVSSLTAQHNIGRASMAFNRSLEKLSSGFKINRGADGPAALVISEKQRAQIAGLKTAIDNTEKAASLVQTAEGALSEINSLLVQVRSLALDSANAGVNDQDALNANQSEITNALDTINRIASNTQFGQKKLLDGSAGVLGVASDTDVTFLRATQQTAEGSHAINVTTGAERAKLSAGTTQTTALAAAEILTVNGVNISLDAGMSQTQVRDRINTYTAQTGVIADITSNKTRLYSKTFGSNASISVISNVAAATNSSGFGTTAATDVGVDVVATIAGTSFTGLGNVVTADSGTARGLSISIAESSDAAVSVTGTQGTVTITDNSLSFQIGANQKQTASIAIAKVTSNSLGLGLANNQFANLSQIDVTSASKAQDALAVIDAAIDDITIHRGALGAFQKNTLEATSNNLEATLENTTNAESVIRDTNFAEEISNFTKQQVLLQGGSSVLSNANQIPQLILGLLKNA